METLATASSVAGLLSLAGQCVAGAQSLRSLYQDIVAASHTVETFVKDVNSLLRTLEDVKALLKKIQHQAPELADEVSLTSLKLQLDDCNQEIDSWLRTAQSTKPVGGKGTRAWFRKFRMAIDKQSRNNVRADMQKRRIEVAVALSTLRRSFDLRLALITESVNNQIHKTHATAQAILNSSADASEAILRLETVSMSMSGEIGSMKSLMSSYSSQSRSEGERSPSPRTLWSKGWQCDQWQLLDDLFCPIEDLQDATQVQRCTFCGLPFLDPPALDVREHHLKVTHRLVACVNKADLYLNEDLFHDHLETVHNAKLGPWTQTLRHACSVHNTPCERTEGYTSFAVNEVKPQCADNTPESAFEPWEDAVPQSNVEALVTSLWDSNLFGQWDSGRDRINRWMLHMLGAEAQHTDVHRSIYQEKYKGALDIPSKMWSRLVLKYWFIDEAATGFELNAVAEKLTPGKLGNNSSLHLSSRPSGTKSDPSLYERKRLTHQHGKPSPLTANSLLQSELVTSIGNVDARIGPYISIYRRLPYSGASAPSRASVLSQVSAPSPVGSRASSIGSIAERLHSPMSERASAALQRLVQEQIPQDQAIATVR